MADPWHDRALGASIPNAAGLTQKVTAFIRGVASVGAGGVGFIAVSPALANDAISMFTSDANYALGHIVPLVANDTPSVGVNSVRVLNLPYETSAFVSGQLEAPHLAGRIVSCSLRVQYIGTTLQQSGLVYHYRSPKHSSAISHTSGGASNAANLATLSSHRETWIRANDRTVSETSDFPHDITECTLREFAPNEYKNDPSALTAAVYPYSKANNDFFDAAGTAFNFTGPGAVRVGAPTMVVAFTGTPGNSVEFEYVVHAEFAGVLTAALGSHTHGDAAGTQKVLNAANRTQVARQRNQKKGSGWPIMEGALREVENEIREVLVPAGENAVAALLHAV